MTRLDLDMYSLAEDSPRYLHHAHCMDLHVSGLTYIPAQSLQLSAMEGKERLSVSRPTTTPSPLELVLSVCSPIATPSPLKLVLSVSRPTATPSPLELVLSARDPTGAKRP